MAHHPRKLSDTPARYDCAYSLAAPSPHVPWARPYSRGPVKAFFLSGVNDGRTVVELMQRLDLTGRAVSMDPRWDVNKWCMDRYGPMDSLAPRDYSVAFSVLEEELASSERYDVIVMHAVRGWFEFPKRVKELLFRRVRRGEGLVFVYPHLGEDAGDTSLWDLSPLVDVPATTLRAPGAGTSDGYPHAPAEGQSGEPWIRVADHFITSGIPFEALPYPALRHYRCRLAEGARALAADRDGNPVIAVRRFGKGRVVGLGYHALGLFPELELRRGEREESFWEYLFSILLRSMVWAAGREPTLCVRSLQVTQTDGSVRLSLSNGGAPADAALSVAYLGRDRLAEGGAKRKLKLARGRTELRLPLPAAAHTADCGRHYVEVSLSAGSRKHDWAAVSYEVPAPARIEELRLDAEAVAAGSSISGSVRASGETEGLTLVAELWDQMDRQIARQGCALEAGSREVQFAVQCPEALTPMGWVRCRLERDGRLLDEARAEVALTAPRHEWLDYEVILPWLHQGHWPWSRLLEEQYRRAGITSTAEARMPFRLTVSMHPPGFGIYWYKRQAYLERRAAYGRTRDTALLARSPCIATEDFRAPVAEALREGIPRILKYSPLAYYLADESSITCYEDALDLCWHPETLAELRLWLERHYGGLEALNAEWETSHGTWDEVVPMTWEQAQARGNPAPWMDHRLFMNHTLAEAFRYAVSVAREVDPEGLVTISGTQTPGSHNGCDWSKIDRIVQYLQPYSGGGQDEMHPSFNRDLILTGFTGYSRSGAPLEYEVWHRLFHGHRGASIFWGYTLLDPDLSLSAQGRSFERVFGEIQTGGLCRLLTGLDRVHDGIALHYSMASGHAWWLSDGWLSYREGELEYGTRSSPAFRRFIESRTAWGTLLEDLGLQYEYLPYAEVEQGKLAPGYRALVLPGSVALSEREVAEIRAFVERGGLLIADVRPGTVDEHGKRRSRGALDDILAAGGAGTGSAVCLRAWLDQYPETRLSVQGAGAREIVRRELEKSSIRPRAQVRGEGPSGGEHPVGVERVSWRGEGVEVCGLLKETRGEMRENPDGTSAYVVRPGMAEEEPVTVSFPFSGHWYDPRAHRYLGDLAEARVSLREAEPAFFVRLPYRVRAITLETDAAATAGAEVRARVTLEVGGAKAIRQIALAEVRRPDGTLHAAGPRSVELRGGGGELRFRLALNDPPGAWRITVTEACSGVRASRVVKVRPPTPLAGCAR